MSPYEKQQRKVLNWSKINTGLMSLAIGLLLWGTGKIEEYTVSMHDFRINTQKEIPDMKIKEQADHDNDQKDIQSDHKEIEQHYQEYVNDKMDRATKSNDQQKKDMSY